MRKNIEILPIEEEISTLEQTYQYLKQFNADDEEKKNALTRQREEILEKMISLKEDLILILYQSYKAPIDENR